MTRSRVVTAQRAYTANALEPRLPGHVFQAVVTAALVDGLTGAPLRGRVRVSTSVPGLRPRASGDGFVGLVGAPGRVFPALAGQAYDADLTVVADGYAPRREATTLPAQPTFPATFEPADLGVLAMHREPVVIEASTYEYDVMNRPVALAGSAVTVTASWATLDQLGQPAVPAELLAVAPGLSAPRPHGSTVDLPPLGLPAEPVRTLLGGVGPGATSILVSHTGSLSIGDLVGLDLADAELAERIEVLGIRGPADTGSPAEVALRFPLRHPHVEGTAVRRITVAGGATPAATLTRAAPAGARTLVVGTLAGLGPGQVVRVSGGTAGPEFASVDVYETTTDTDGFGRLPPVTGLAAVEVSAVSGTQSARALVTLTQSARALGLDLTLD